MGTLAFGKLGDAAYDHEGWLASILPDGTGTGSYTADQPANIGHRPTCECGWHGPDNHDYPGQRFLPDEIEDRLMEPWDRHIDEVTAELDTGARLDAVSSARAAMEKAIRDAHAHGIDVDTLCRRSDLGIDAVARIVKPTVRLYSTLCPTCEAVVWKPTDTGSSAWPTGPAPAMSNDPLGDVPHVCRDSDVAAKQDRP